MSGTLIFLTLLVHSAQADQSVERLQTRSTRLYVRTVPSGATIILAGEPLGKSDGLFVVAPGNYKMTVELDGHGLEHRVVEIRAERVTRVTIELRPKSNSAVPLPPNIGVEEDRAEAMADAESSRPPSSAAGPTVEDFLPPVLGGPTDIVQADKVVVEGRLIRAATAQDAINAAIRKIFESIGRTDLAAARMVRFPGGLGFVATGTAAYQKVSNTVEARRAKRNAYVTAFCRAKKGLAEILGGLSNESNTEVRQALMRVGLANGEMTDSATETTESLRQTVDMMLRGFVVYQVDENSVRNEVSVSIVTTPQTRVELRRLAPHVIEANQLREALNQILAEVRSGLIPPVGGRIITVRSTGETALVGFGSHVVGTASTPAEQASLDLDAQDIARMRAMDALTGLFFGDKTSWQGNVVTSMRDEMQEFQVVLPEDPLRPTSPRFAIKLEEIRKGHVSSVEVTKIIRSRRAGVLPPGIVTRTWFDADHAWAYGMSLYAPSLTKAAREAADEMSVGPESPDARILRDGD